jgi:hypothetical protein
MPAPSDELQRTRSQPLAAMQQFVAFGDSVAMRTTSGCCKLQIARRANWFGHEQSLPQIHLGDPAASAALSLFQMLVVDFGFQHEEALALPQFLRFGGDLAMQGECLIYEVFQFFWFHWVFGFLAAFTVGFTAPRIARRETFTPGFFSTRPIHPRLFTSIHERSWQFTSVHQKFLTMFDLGQKRRSYSHACE